MLNLRKICLNNNSYLNHESSFRFEEEKEYALSIDQKEKCKEFENNIKLNVGDEEKINLISPIDGKKI